MNCTTITFDAAAEAAHSDVSPFLAATDEASYIADILPLMAPADQADTRDDEAEEQRQAWASERIHVCRWTCHEQGCPTHDV